MTENNVIGGDNRLLWRLPNDLQYFKSVTMGKPIVMGRKTYESIGRLLPGRRNIVLTTQRDFVLVGGEVMHSVEEVLSRTQTAEEVMITGGGEIYRLFLPWVVRMYITRVHTQLSGDTMFPTWDFEVWHKISSTSHQKDDRHEYDYTFEVWDKK